MGVADLYGADGQHLSQRDVRRSVKEQQLAMLALCQGFSMFMSLGFFGRLKWFLFGIAPVAALRRPPAADARGSDVGE